MPKRFRIITNNYSSDQTNKNVVYLMRRDYRAEDNWALILAQKYAKKLKSELYVVSIIRDKYVRFESRHYYFLLHSLQELELDLKSKNLRYDILNNENDLKEYVTKHNVGVIIYDLRSKTPQAFL